MCTTTKMLVSKYWNDLILDSPDEDELEELTVRVQKRYNASARKFQKKNRSSLKSYIVLSVLEEYISSFDDENVMI